MAKLSALADGCVTTLVGSQWSEALGLFPFSSRRDGAEVRHDYTNPLAIRYTINTLLGLHEAASGGRPGVTSTDVAAMTQGFLERNRDRIATPADWGLLLLLLDALGHDDTGAALDQLEARSKAASGGLSVQDLAWGTWGASVAARRSLPRAGAVARGLTDRILSEYVNERTGLPRHSVHRYRRSIVSFGALSYFLRAMYEASRTLGDERPARLFAEGVKRICGLQGPKGEWPWMIHNRTGSAFDFYPVFSVHQDSMAMLFLLPALDEGHEVAETIRRSLNWVEGANELDLRFYLPDPLFAYRSIERCDRAPQARRYLRAAAHSFHHRPARLGGVPIRVNDECRSYHLGWILYAWSRRTELDPNGSSGRARVYT